MPICGEKFDFNLITIIRRPLWLTYHSPLVKESKGGKLLPANRSQVKERENLEKKSFFSFPSDHHLA